MELAIFRSQRALGVPRYNRTVAEQVKVLQDRFMFEKQQSQNVGHIHVILHLCFEWESHKQFYKSIIVWYDAFHVTEQYVVQPYKGEQGPFGVVFAPKGTTLEEVMFSLGITT